MRLIFLFIFTLASFLLPAQNVRFSVIADPQFSWMVPNEDNISREGAILGMNAGMLLDIFFAENYAFATGVTISNLGGKLNYSDQLIYTTPDGRDTIPSNTTITYKLQYISIPLGLKFKTNEIGYATYYANLGLNPMFSLKSHANFAGGNEEKVKIPDEISFFNINYFILLGMQYSLGGSTAITGGLGYSSGFTDITSRASDKITINSVTIRLGIIF
jgi:hypothetical protein